MMSFAAPLFLIAALAGIIPLLIHLIHRQKAKEIPFPTLRFLQLSVQRTRRRRYLDDALLLLLRIALLALLAFGLARPALNSLRNLIGGNQPGAAVLILDNSGSMGSLDGDSPRFETARELATNILDQFDTGDAAALLFTCGNPSTSQARFFRSHAPLRQELAAARVYPESADLAASLQQARKLLDSLEAASRPEIYVLTDNQALSWKNLKAPAQDDKATSGPTPVIVVDTRGEPLLNASVRSLNLQSPAPVAGALVIVKVEVANPAAVDQQKHLELRLDDSQIALSPTLTLPAQGATTHEFRFTVDDPGIHQGQIQLVEDDANALDNNLFFALNIDPDLPLAIIKPRRHEIPQADDAFYLERALASPGTRVTTLTPDQLLSPTALDGQAVAFCVNLPALEPDAAVTLKTYAQKGGHLVWIAGPNIDPDAYNQMNQEQDNSLLPALLGPVRVPADDAQGGWRLASLDATHPALATLTSPPSLYQSVLVFRYLPIAADAAVRHLATLDNGDPLLVEKAVGQGSTLWLGVAAREDWTNLPLKPLFLPLLSRLTHHLAGSLSGQSQTLAGAPITIPLRTPGAEVEVVRPGGEVLRVKPSDPTDTSLQYADTHDPGLYLFRDITSTPTRTQAYAINGDPVESDDDPLPPAELQQCFSAQSVALCASPAELEATLRRLREGTPLRDAFLALVLAALVFEAFFANRRRALPPGQQAATPASTLTTEAPLTNRLILGDDQVILLADDC